MILPEKYTQNNYEKLPAVNRSLPFGREDNGEGNISDLVDLSEWGWDSFLVKKQLQQEWVKWLSGFADWRHFVTLTFEDYKEPDVAKSLFRWWVTANNRHLLGNHYTKVVGHSYFSYVVALEWQKRDVVHFHVLVDKPFDYFFSRAIWQGRCGWVGIDQVRDFDKTLNYLCKYISKGGEIEPYKAKIDYIPKVKPSWWLDGR